MLSISSTKLSRCLFVAAVLSAILCTNTATAGVVFTFEPALGGTAVAVTAEGTYDVTGQSQFGFHGIPQSTAYRLPSNQRFVSIEGASLSYSIGGALTIFDPVDDFESTQPPVFGQKLGDNFGLISFPENDIAGFLVPGQDLSGTISGSTVFQNLTLAEVNPVEQTIVWGPGEGQWAQIVVVPEPSILLIIGMGTLLFLRRRRA